MCLIVKELRSGKGRAGTSLSMGFQWQPWEGRTPHWSWSEAITKLVWEHLMLWDSGSRVRDGSCARADTGCPVSHLASLNPDFSSVKSCDDNNSPPAIFIGVRRNHGRKWASRTVICFCGFLPWLLDPEEGEGVWSGHLPAAWRAAAALGSSVCLTEVTDPFEKVTTNRNAHKQMKGIVKTTSGVYAGSQESQLPFSFI